MAVIIKNMDLPDNCQACRFACQDSRRCFITYDKVADNFDHRRCNCPLYSMQGLIDDVKKLQTYKIGADDLLVELEDVVKVLGGGNEEN